ncbi:MAG TPA: hypothetical protein VL921_02185 [Candidatus Udaeobacter sp.]|nr:hypothetical protein [Candidatus Udaeobacter sp.]
MNKSVHDFGRSSSKHMLNLLIIVPLLLTALFAYQAGNSFEQTAGASRMTAAVQYTTSITGKQRTGTKVFLPENVLPAAAMYALMLMSRLSANLSALRTSVPQRLRDLLMTPIKFTSQFVG